MSKVTTALVAGSGWIFALALGFLDLPAKVNGYFDNAPSAVAHVSDLYWRSAAFAGAWTNEGP